MLISTGSVWKFLDTGTNLGSTWRGLSFNDSAWLSGSAELGYSNNPVTIVGFGPDPNNKYTTTYFRRAFAVTNASAFTDLKLRVLRDDGAVVYLNNVEVFRSNMPEGIISNATPASAVVGGTDETTFFPTNVSAAALVSGTNILAVEVHQQSGTSTDLGFDLELVAGARDLGQPGISIIANQTTDEDTPITIPFTVADLDTPAWSLVIAGSSANQNLVADADIFIDGSGTNRTLTIFPAPDQSGTTLITLRVTDGTASASNSFVLTVNPVNDAPTLNPIPDVGLVAGFGNTTIPFNGISSGAANESQSLTVTAVSSNTALMTINSLSYTSPATNGNLVLKRVSSTATGKAVVAVTVNDGGASNNLVTRTFTVFVRSSGNSAPVISGASLTNRITSEDTATPAIPFTVGDSVTPATLLTLVGNSSNPILIPTNNIIFGGSGSNRTVTITPMPNRFGAATIRISVLDTNFGIASTNFLLTVTPVNDAPVISSIANQIISEDGSTGPINFTVNDVEKPAASLTVSATSTNQILVPGGNLVFGGSGTNRVLVVTPATNQFGITLITVTVNDGTTSTSTSFILTVNPVNDPPTISFIADQVTREDTASGAIAFTIGDLETAAGGMNLSATSSNPALIAGYSFGGSGASRTLVVLPATNQFGSATVTLTVDDGNGGTASTSFLLSVSPVNDPPTLDPIGNVFLNQGAGQQTINLTGITSGPTNESQTLVVSATSSNPGLVPNPQVNYTSPNATGTITFTPHPSTNGTATITVTVNDGQGTNNLVSRSFTVSVNGVPTISGVADQATSEDTPTAAIFFQVRDAETPATSLVITINSSNASLVPTNNIVLSGSGTNRNLVVTPVSNQSGSVTITLSVRDVEGNLASTSFVLTVNPVNDAPTLDGIGNLAINEDAGVQTVNLSGITSGATNEVQVLGVTATSSQPSIIPNPSITYTSPSTTGSLSFTPVANANGTAVITVSVNDGGSSNNLVTRSFTVTVNAVNDPPFVSGIVDQATDEDVPTGAIAFTIGDLETPAANLQLTGGSSNPTLVPDANIVFGGSGTNRTVTLTPATNQFGTTVISLVVADGDGAKITNLFLLTVRPINDSPFISEIAAQGTTEDISVGPIAFSIGDVETAAEALVLSGRSSNLALVPNANIVFSGSGNNRAVTITPATNQFGSTVITISVADADGGSNTTSFVLTVNELNDPPVISGVSGQVIGRDQSSAEIPIRIGDVETPAENLVLSGSSSNPALVPNANIFFSGSGSNRTFRIVPATNQFGTATITLIVADGNGGTASTSFVLSVKAVTRGPYLQQGTPNSILVRWRTDSATDSRVLYGTNPANLNLAANIPDLATEHIVRLTGLTPDTVYFYAVGASTTELARGPGYFFTTAPTNAKPTRIWVIGDAGLKTTNQWRVRDAYYTMATNRYTDLWLQLGDNAYDSGTDAEYQEALFDTYPQMLRQTVMWPTIGNHEFYSAVSYSQFDYLDIFSLPTAGEVGGVPSGSKKYYSFNYGNIHFVCLDSMTSDRVVGGVMLNWLAADLAANTKDWLIAFWHHPPYSKGTHESDYETELMDMRVNAVPMLEAYGVDMVLCGHSHSYERSYFLDGHYGTSDTLVPNMKLDAGSGRRDETGAYMKSGVGPVSHQGTVYVVAGSSGETVAGDLNHPAMFLSLNELGSVVLDINGQTLEAKFLRDDGVVADYFTIAKGVTNPFRVMKLHLSPGFIEVTWNSKPGMAYRVEYASNLNAAEWLDRSGPLQAVGTTMRWKGAIDPSKSAGYYRVVTLGN